MEQKKADSDFEEKTGETCTVQFDLLNHTSVLLGMFYNQRKLSSLPPVYFYNSVSIAPIGTDMVPWKQQSRNKWVETIVFPLIMLRKCFSTPM